MRKKVVAYVDGLVLCDVPLPIATFTADDTEGAIAWGKPKLEKNLTPEERDRASYQVEEY